MSIFYFAIFFVTQNVGRAEEGIVLLWVSGNILINNQLTVFAPTTVGHTIMVTNIVWTSRRTVQWDYNWKGVIV